MAASRIHPPHSFEHAPQASSGPNPAFDAHDAQLDSALLLHGQREVLIRHGTELYRLRHTRNDKLILTK